MKVPYRGREKSPPDEREQGITKITIHYRHRTGPDAALEAIADD
jgi:hypothetical protein